MMFKFKEALPMCQSVLGMSPTIGDLRPYQCLSWGHMNLVVRDIESFLMLQCGVALCCV